MKLPAKLNHRWWFSATEGWLQQMASVDTDTGEFQEKRLTHREEAEKFYRALIDKKVRVGQITDTQSNIIVRLSLLR